MRKKAGCHGTDRAWEEHCASHPPDRRSDQFDENVQVDVTMRAAKYGIELSSISAQPAVALESNVAARVENSEAVVKEMEEGTLLPLQRG